jgi:hypothetical protein
MMNRKLLIPVVLALWLIPALACQTVLGALGAGATPTPPLVIVPPVDVLPDIETALPSLLEGTPPAIPTELSVLGTPPPDIPVVDQAENLTGSQFLVSYETSKAFDDVVKFYEDGMPAQGWKSSGSPTTLGGFAVLNYTKDKRAAVVTITAAEGKTSVAVVITGQ